MKKFRKILYVLIVFAMILQVAPAFGGLAATEENYIIAEDYETAENEAIAAEDNQDYVPVVATSNGDSRVVLRAVADTTTLPHVPGVWANGANDTFSVVTYNSRNFIRFDAQEHVVRRDDLERATLRLHFYRMANTAAALPNSWPFFLPVYIWDAWPNESTPGNPGRLWEENTLGWQNLWGGALPNGNSMWRHMQTTDPDQALAAAMLYGTPMSAGWVSQAWAWHPPGHNGQGQPTFSEPDLDRLPLTATNAFLYQEREPGSIITGFLVDKVHDKWFEIDITDFVLSSMLEAGDRDLYSLTGTGWGRDGHINIGFNGGPSHQTAPGGAAVLEMLFSTRERLGGAFAPELVLEFFDPDPLSTIVREETASTSIQTLNTIDFGNFGRPPENIIFNNNLTVWNGGSPGEGTHMYGNSLVQFDISDLIVAPAGYRINEAWIRLRTVGVDNAELGLNVPNPEWNRHVLLQIRPRTVAISLVNDDWSDLAVINPSAGVASGVPARVAPAFTLGEHPGILDTIYRTVTPVNEINSTQYVNVTRALDFLGYGGNMDVLSFRLHSHGSGPQFWTEFAGIDYPNQEFRPTLIVTYVECDLNSVIYDRQPITASLGDIGIVNFGTPWSPVLATFNTQFPTVMVEYRERGGSGVHVFEHYVEWPGFTNEWDSTDSGTLQTITGRIGALVNPSEAAGLDLRDSGAARVTATVTVAPDGTVEPPPLPTDHPGIARQSFPVLADTFALGWNAAHNNGASQYMTIRHEHAAFIRFNASDYAQYRGTIERAVIRMYINPPAWPYAATANVDNRNWTFPVVSMVLIDPWADVSIPGNPGTIWEESGENALIGNTVNPASGQRQVAYGLKSLVANGMMYTETRNRLANREQGSFVALYGIGQGYGNRWVEVDVTDYVIASMNPAGTRQAVPTAGTGWGRDGIINIGIKNHMISGGGQGQSAFNIATRESGRGAELIITFTQDEEDFDVIEFNPVEAGALVINQREAGWQNTQGTNVNTVLPVRDGGFATFGNTTNLSALELNIAESYLKFDVSDLADFAREEILDVRLRLTAESVRGRDNQPRMAFVSVARDNWTSNTLSWADRPIFPDADMPDNIGFIYNAQVGETIYVDVTAALDFLDAYGSSDYLTLRLAHAGRAQNWPLGHDPATVHMGTNFHGVLAANSAFRPQLIVRTIESTDGFTELNLTNNGTVAEILGVNNSDEAIEATLFAVMLDGGGRFVNAFSHPITLPMGAGSNWSDEITIVGNDANANQLESISGGMVRVFLWEGNGSLMRPVRGITPQDYTL